MSLAAAVNLIADAMEDKGMELGGEFVKQWLFTFSSQLRIAVKASGEDDDSRINEMEQRLREGPRQDLPRVQRALDRLGDRLRTEDQVGERMVLCVGGPDDGVTVPLNSSMPVGAYCVSGGAVYQLGADGKVYFMKEQGA